MLALGRHADPLQLPLQGLLAPLVGLLLLGHAPLLLLQPAGVVALPGDALAPVQLQDPARHVVQEVAVVGDGDDGAGVVLQVLLQPGHGLGIQVVGGFVQQQDVGLLQEQTAERHAPAFTAGQHTHLGVGVGAAQGVHGLLQAGVQVPAVVGVDLLLQLALLGQQCVHVGVGIGELIADGVIGLHPAHLLGGAFFHGLADGLLRIQGRLLLQHPRGVAPAQHGLAVEVVVHASHDAQHGALAGAVEAQHTDLGPQKVAEGDVLDDRLAVVDLGDPHHRVDDLGLVALGLGHGGIRQKGRARRGLSRIAEPVCYCRAAWAAARVAMGTR